MAATSKVTVGPTSGNQSQGGVAVLKGNANSGGFPLTCTDPVLDEVLTTEEYTMVIHSANAMLTKAKTEFSFWCLCLFFTGNICWLWVPGFCIACATKDGIENKAMATWKAKGFLCSVEECCGTYTMTVTVPAGTPKKIEMLDAVQQQNQMMMAMQSQMMQQQQQQMMQPQQQQMTQPQVTVQVMGQASQPQQQTMQQQPQMVGQASQPQQQMMQQQPQMMGQALMPQQQMMQQQQPQMVGQGLMPQQQMMQQQQPQMVGQALMPQQDMIQPQFGVLPSQPQH